MTTIAEACVHQWELVHKGVMELVIVGSVRLKYDGPNKYNGMTGMTQKVRSPDLDEYKCKTCGQTAQGHLRIRDTLDDIGPTFNDTAVVTGGQ